MICSLVVSSYYCHKRDMLESRLRSDLLSGSKLLLLPQEGHARI